MPRLSRECEREIGDYIHHTVGRLRRTYGVSGQECEDIHERVFTSVRPCQNPPVCARCPSPVPVVMCWAQIEEDMVADRRDRLDHGNKQSIERRVERLMSRSAEQGAQHGTDRRTFDTFQTNVHGNGHGNGHPPPQHYLPDARHINDRRSAPAPSTDSLGHGSGYDRGGHDRGGHDRGGHDRGGHNVGHNGGGYNGGSGNHNGGGGGHDSRRDGGGGSEPKRQRVDPPAVDSALVGAPSAGQMRRTRVKTNFATLQVNPQLEVTQYDIKFQSKLDTPVKSVEGRQEIVEDVQLMQLLGNSGASSWAYDGALILYVSAPLALGAAAESGGWAHGEAHTDERPSFTKASFPGTNRSVKVTITMASKLTYSEVSSGICSRDALSALDVAFKQYSTTAFKSVGQGFYDESGRRPWAKVQSLPGNGMYEMWLGKRHSIVMTARGAMLQIDRTATAMLAPLNLVEFVAKVVKKRDSSQLSLADCKGAAATLHRSPKKWKIEASHSKRKWTLRGIDSVPCSESMFENGEGCTLSVATYFKDRYSITLRRPDLPCVLVGSAKEPERLRLPMEICKFVACQPAPVTAEVQQEQIKLTSGPVRERMHSIQAIHRDLLVDHKEKDSTLKGFQTSMSTSLAQAGAVILESPVLQYRDARDALVEVRANPQKGEWNLRNPSGRGDLKFIESGSNQGGFVVIKFDRAEDRDVETFTRKLESMARERGMDLGRRLGRVLDGSGKSRSKDVVAFLDSNIKMIEQREGTRVGLVLAVIGSNVAQNAKELYPAIKRWSHTIAHIPTQCVQGGPGKAMGKLMTSPQYHAGLLLKINLKLGGANGILPAHKGGLALLREEPTMVMGYDINHPQPGSRKPSYAALVAMMDTECTKTFTAVGAQKSRTEIAGFVDKVRACLRAFANFNKVPPRRIVFYRDGVADNQFDELRQVECPQILEACELETMPLPKLTVIIVQQRTKARFATEDDKQVEAGTVINQDIVGADKKDWYMVSQHGLKGTARPCHYHILHDDLDTNPEFLQRLTFDLCHLYARATKIVSRPAPVYYAHRAAFLAQYYKDDYKEENMFEVGSTTSTGSLGSNASSIQEIALGANIASTVYFA